MEKEYEDYNLKALEAFKNSELMNKTKIASIICVDNKGRLTTIQPGNITKSLLANVLRETADAIQQQLNKMQS